MRKVLVLAGLLVSLNASAGSITAPLAKVLAHAPDEEAGYKYIGSKASLKFVDASLGDVIQQFSKSYEFEAVVDKEVAARKVTLEVANMPWDAALYTMLSQAGVKAKLEGGKLHFFAADAKK